MGGVHCRGRPSTIPGYHREIRGSGLKPDWGKPGLGVASILTTVALPSDGLTSPSSPGGGLQACTPVCWSRWWRVRVPAISARQSGSASGQWAWVWPGCEDHVRPARHVELLAGGIGPDLVQALHPQGPGGAHRREDPDEAGVSYEVGDAAALLVVAPRMPDHRRLALVRPDVYAELLVHASREPHVIEVPVSEYNYLDVTGRPSELRQRALERFSGRRVSGVDHCQLPLLLDEERIHVCVVDHVDALDDVLAQHVLARTRSCALRPGLRQARSSKEDPFPAGALGH
jgi:hypothetical protein